MAVCCSHGCIRVVELVGASRASLCACSWKPRARHWNERGERRKQKSENGKFAFGLSGGLCVEMSVLRVGKCNRKYHHIWQRFDKSQPRNYGPLDSMVVLFEGLYQAVISYDSSSTYPLAASKTRVSQTSTRHCCHSGWTHTAKVYP